MNSHFLDRRVVFDEFAATGKPLPSICNSVSTVGYVFCIFGQRTLRSVVAVGSAIHGLCNMDGINTYIVEVANFCLK